ncbi:MAG: DUF4175 family protein [Rubricoccaceae bacterium]
MSDRSLALVVLLRRRLAVLRRRLALAEMAHGLLVALGVLGMALLAATLAEAALWLGPGLRQTLAWALGFGALALVARGLGRPLLRSLGVLPGLDERAVARAGEAARPGLADRLTTLLDLADGRAAETPDALRDAAVQALGADLEGVPFDRVPAFGRARRALLPALAPALLLTLFFALAPGTFTGAMARLLAPGTAFAPPAPFALAVAPGDTALVRGADLPVRAFPRGRGWPETATLEFGRVGERATETARLRLGPEGAWTHTLAALEAPTRYRLVAGAVVSPWYTADVVARPLVRGLQVTVQPPAYSGQPARRLPPGVGDVTGLAGSAVRVAVGLAGEPTTRAWLDVRWGDGRAERVPLRLGADGGTATFALRGPGTYRVALETAAGVPNADAATYSLGVLSDGPPQIALLEGAEEALSPAPRTLRFHLTDDFGFSSGAVVWRLAESRTRAATPFRRLALPVRPRPLDQEVAATWTFPGAQPGDVVEFYGEVRDNDAVRGFKAARTPVFTLRYPALTERFDEARARRDSTREALDALRREAERSGDRVRQLRDEIRRNPSPDAESRRQVDALRRQQQALERQAAQLQQQLERLLDDAREGRLMSEETLRALEQMRQVMQELDSPELREALRRLQEAMEQMDLRQMLEQSDRAAFSEEQFRQRLERALEMMRRLEVAARLDEAARRAEDLARTEERLARETERLRQGRAPSSQQDRRPDEPRDAPSPQSPSAERERLAEEQRRAAEDARALERLMEQIGQQMQDLRNAPRQPMQDAQQQMQQDGGLPQQMQQNAQQLQQNQLRDAQQGQEDLARRLRRLQQQMQRMSQTMQGQQRRIDAAGVRRALEDVLTLSREQEALAGRTAATPSRSAALRPHAQRQAELRTGLRTVTDSLRTLARTVPQLGRAVEERTGNGLREMDLAVSELAELRAGPAAAHQRMAMAHLNELGLLLAEVLENLDEQGGGQGAGGLPQQLQQTGEQQQRLNEQIQQMLNDIAGERLSRSQEERLRQAAEQQEAIRRQLREALRQDGQQPGRGLDPQTRSALQQIERQMEESARQLRRGRLDTRTLPRQQQILQQLLETQRSVNEQGQEERREGEAGRARPDPTRPDRLAPREGPADRLRRDLIRALESGYASDYQELIKRYFQRLQQRAE